MHQYYKIVWSFALFFLVMAIGILFATDSDVVDAAKKEKERRSQVTAPHKTFTNKDIEAFKAKNKDKTPKSSTTTKQAQTQTQTNATSDDEDAEEDPYADYEQQKAYWTGRYAEIRDKIKSAEADVDRLTPIVDALKSTYVKGNDTQQIMRLQAEVDEKDALLQAAKKTLDEANQELEDLEEEGRKAGALPGWFRD